MEKPNYVQFDHKNRELYLSQLDNFSPAERSLFHKLCEMWEPLIPIRPFLMEASKLIANCDTELTRLMKKLQKHGLGIVKTQIAHKERRLEGIILCEKQSKLFYINLLEEEIISVLLQPQLELPTIKNLQEKNIIIPGTYLSQTTFVQAFELDEDSIVSLYLEEDVSIVAPQSLLESVFDIHLIKARDFFQNDALVDIISQMMSLRLIDFRNSVISNNTLFWFEIGRTCIEKRPHLESQQKARTTPHFFIIMKFIQHYASALLSIERKIKEIKKNRLDDIHRITQLIKDYDSLIVSAEEFEHCINSMKDSYENAFSEFRDEFLETTLKPNENKSIATILQINGSYIHRDNIKTYFLRGIESLSQELYVHYIKKMKASIKNPGRFGMYAFNSIDNFEKDIMNEIMERNVFMHSLFEKPDIVAEAILLSNQKSARVKSLEEMKASLSRYFYPEKVQFKEFQTIFDLNLNIIYQRAFNSLGIFRQLMLKILGKHERYARRYSQQSIALRNRVYQSQNKDSDKSQESVNNLGTADNKQIRPGIVKDLPQKQARSRKRKKKTHMYTAKEKERAWSDFAQRIKK